MSNDVINFWGSCSRLNPVKGSAMTLQSLLRTHPTNRNSKAKFGFYCVELGTAKEGHGDLQKMQGRFHLLASRPLLLGFCRQIGCSRCLGVKTLDLQNFGKRCSFHVPCVKVYSERENRNAATLSLNQCERTAVRLGSTTPEGDGWQNS